GGLCGTFRNTGQAGSYFGVMLALTLPAFLCGLIKWRVVNTLMLAAVALALIFTFKRAAIVGTTVGALLLGLMLAFSRSSAEKRLGAKMLVISAFGSAAAIMLLLWGVDNVSSMSWRIETKFTPDNVEDWSESFWMDNLRSAIAAFSDHPFIGVGLGNVEGVYTPRHEIHSSYFAI